MRKSGKVLFALPTAQLASRMRERFANQEGVDVDTCAAAFRFGHTEQDCLPLLTPYELVVVDEISLLDRDNFERIVRLWQAADKVPALVILGDKYQLPG